MTESTVTTQGATAQHGTSDSASGGVCSADRARPSRIPAVVGIAYTGSWIAGLSVWPSNLKASANGAQVLAGYTGHKVPSLLSYLFTEGLPAAGLAVVGLALAAAARRSGGPRRAATVATTAISAALISVTQFVLGALLTLHAVPRGDASQAHALFEAVNRLDGVKMLILAALALAAAPLAGRWLRWTAYALAVSIVASGIGYLLLASSLTGLAYVSGPLLLAWITGSGVALSRPAR